MTFEQATNRIDSILSSTVSDPSDNLASLIGAVTVQVGWVRMRAKCVKDDAEYLFEHETDRLRYLSEKSPDWAAWRGEALCRCEFSIEESKTIADSAEDVTGMLGQIEHYLRELNLRAIRLERERDAARDVAKTLALKVAAVKTAMGA